MFFENGIVSIPHEPGQTHEGVWASVRVHEAQLREALGMVVESNEATHRLSETSSGPEIPATVAAQHLSLRAVADFVQAYIDRERQEGRRPTQSGVEKEVASSGKSVSRETLRQIFKDKMGGGLMRGRPRKF
jgi:hypothetical protein